MPKVNITPYENPSGQIITAVPPELAQAAATPVADEPPAVVAPEPPVSAVDEPMSFVLKGNTLTISATVNSAAGAEGIARAITSLSALLK